MCCCCCFSRSLKRGIGTERAKEDFDWDVCKDLASGLCMILWTGSMVQRVFFFCLVSDDSVLSTYLSLWSFLGDVGRCIYV